MITKQDLIRAIDYLEDRKYDRNEVEMSPNNWEEAYNAGVDMCVAVLRDIVKKEG